MRPKKCWIRAGKAVSLSDAPAGLKRTERLEWFESEAMNRVYAMRDELCAEHPAGSSHERERDEHRRDCVRPGNRATIEIAAHAGTCYGVQRALDMALAAAPQEGSALSSYLGSAHP